MQRQADCGGADGDRVDTDRAVAAFLRANPGWLARHPDLYAVLDPPRRVHGETVADHMAAMLSEARRRGTDAAADRRAAEGFTRLVQDAVLALMRAPNPAWSVANDLPGLLRIEGVRLCVEGLRPETVPLALGTVNAILGHRTALVRGMGDGGVARMLHGEVAPLVVREALVRVPLAAGPGLLALAARDPAGLNGAGTQALAFLGQAVAAALERT